MGERSVATGGLGLGKIMSICASSGSELVDGGSAEHRGELACGDAVCKPCT